MSTKRNEAELVLRFSYYMLLKLRNNSYKPHWLDDSLFALFSGVKRETAELRRELDQARPGIADHPHSHYIVLESADVANFAAMIADHTGFLAETKVPAPYAYPGGTQAMHSDLLQAERDRDRWADRNRLLELRADLAARVLRAEPINRHPLVLQAAADAVQERALEVEGRTISARQDHECSDVDHSTVEWLRATARELRRIERDLRGEAQPRTDGPRVDETAPPVTAPHAPVGTAGGAAQSSLEHLRYTKHPPCFVCGSQSHALGPDHVCEDAAGCVERAQGGPGRGGIETRRGLGLGGNKCWQCGSADYEICCVPGERPWECLHIGNCFKRAMERALREETGRG